jgi:hypothetical protein
LNTSKKHGHKFSNTGIFLPVFAIISRTRAKINKDRQK